MAARRGGSSCEHASARSPGRSNCAWCARSTSLIAASASSGSRTTREHAEWILAAFVDEADGGASLTTQSRRYSGRLWGSAALERALDEEIRRGKVALSELVSAEPTR